METGSAEERTQACSTTMGHVGRVSGLGTETVENGPTGCHQEGVRTRMYVPFGAVMLVEPNNATLETMLAVANTSGNNVPSMGLGYTVGTCTTTHSTRKSRPIFVIEPTYSCTPSIFACALPRHSSPYLLPPVPGNTFVALHEDVGALHGKVHRQEDPVACMPPK